MGAGLGEDGPDEVLLGGRGCVGDDEPVGGDPLLLDAAEEGQVGGAVPGDDLAELVDKPGATAGREFEDVLLETLEVERVAQAGVAGGGGEGQDQFRGKAVDAPADAVLGEAETILAELLGLSVGVPQLAKE